MGLEKAIKYGKEHRKPHRGGKAVDSHCNNHGECFYCRSDRLKQRIVAEQVAAEKVDEALTFPIDKD